jgi:hypothetical protein
MENAAAAYGVYRDDTYVAEVVDVLNGAGFANEDLCVVLAPTHPIAESVRRAVLLITEGENRKATAALIGWPSGLGAVLIPKVGFFIRSRVFFNGLVVAKDASAICGSRTVVSLGFSDRDARRFETQLEHAGFLVYVACEEYAYAEWASELLRATGAKETTTLEKMANAGAAA